MLNRKHSDSSKLSEIMAEAWRLSRELHGNTITVHTPGMFVVNGERGRYQAVSVTGSKCELSCKHCGGSLLKTMPHAETPQALYKFGMWAWERGDSGFLISGGCDHEGKLPWKRFLPIIEKLKSETNLKITVHAGQVDFEIASLLKKAGVDQALVDVIGHDSTVHEIYNLSPGTAIIRKTLESLSAAELEIVPHILFGLHYGRQKGEYSALQMLKDYPLRKYVVVVLVPMRGTAMEFIEPPAPQDVALFIASARIELPHLKASLGCARPRGYYQRVLDVLAINSGVNSMALASEPAIHEAINKGLNITYQQACCSMD